MKELRLDKWECKVFCSKHTKIGKKKLDKLKIRRGNMRKATKPRKEILGSDDEQQGYERRKTR
jgi:hypothetical protein